MGFGISPVNLPDTFGLASNVGCHLPGRLQHSGESASDGCHSPVVPSTYAKVVVEVKCRPTNVPLQLSVVVVHDPGEDSSLLPTRLGELASQSQERRNVGRKVRGMDRKQGESRPE